MKRIEFFWLTFLILLITFQPIKAQESEKDSQLAVNPLELINSHLGDSYFWPLLGVEKKSYTLPLPVILYGPDHKWYFFQSFRLWEGASYKGFYIAKEGNYQGKIVYKNSSGEEERPLDLSFTRNALALFLSSAILVFFLLSFKRFYKRKPKEMPKRTKGVIEMLMFMLIDEVIKPTIGKSYKKYTPYLLTLFFFILTINLMGLIVVFPGGVNLSGNVSVTLVLAACTLVITIFSGTKGYWKEIFWPDVPMWLNAPLPIMTIIEIFGIFSKPFALMVRMFANLFGGHVISIVLVSLIFIFAPFGVWVEGLSSIFVVIFSVFMLLIEVLVCFIQAYVFFMLTTLFIGLAKVDH